MSPDSSFIGERLNEISMITPSFLWRFVSKFLIGSPDFIFLSCPRISSSYPGGAKTEMFLPCISLSE